jgi:cobalamin biosynthesis protein CobT
MAKHIREFKSYTAKRKLTDSIKESVMIVNDIYKVRATVDIPQSLLNAYVKKVKDNTDKNVRQFFSDTELAEEIVKVILQQNMDIEKLSPNMIFGDKDNSISKSETPAEDQSSNNDQDQNNQENSSEDNNEEVNNSNDNSDEFEEVKPESNDDSNSDVKIHVDSEKEESNNLPS